MERHYTSNIDIVIIEVYNDLVYDRMHSRIGLPVSLPLWVCVNKVAKECSHIREQSFVLHHITVEHDFKISLILLQPVLMKTDPPFQVVIVEAFKICNNMRKIN